MDYTLEDKVTSYNSAKAMLERFKQKECEFKMHSKRLNKNTVVYCKNEDRLEEYEKVCNK